MRELAQVKHDLEAALTEVLATNEERARTSQTHQQEQAATGGLRQQLLDAEEKVSSSWGQRNHHSFKADLWGGAVAGRQHDPGVPLSLFRCVVTCIVSYPPLSCTNMSFT